MTDFLNNLAAKSLNLTEVVQPRLTMMFEPQQPSAWLTPGLDFNMNQVDGEQQTIKEGELNAFSNMKPVVDYPTDSKSLIRAKPGVSLIDVDGQKSTSLSVTKGQLHQAAGQDKRNPVIKQEIRASEEKKKKQPERKEELPVLTANMIERQPVPKTLSPSMLVVQSPISFAFQKVPTLKAPAETPQPTPTVNVTIGRIEVRATPPPLSKSRKQRSKPPVMSLEEYLQKRSTGGRE